MALIINAKQPTLLAQLGEELFRIHAATASTAPATTSATPVSSRIRSWHAHQASVNLAADTAPHRATSLINPPGILSTRQTTAT